MEIEKLKAFIEAVSIKDLRDSIEHLSGLLCTLETSKFFGIPVEMMRLAIAAKERDGASSLGKAPADGPGEPKGS